MAENFYILDSDENELIDDEVLIDMVDDFDADEAQQLCDLLNRAWAARMKRIHVKISQDRFFVLAHVSPECQMQTPTVTYQTPYNQAELSAMVDTLQTSEAITAVIEGVRSGKYVIADESSKLTNLCSHDTCSANCDDQSCQPRHTAIPLSDDAASRMRAITNDVYITSDPIDLDQWISVKYDTSKTSFSEALKQAEAILKSGMHITSGPIDQNGYAPIEPNGQPVDEPTATPIYVYQLYGKWCFERELKDSGVWTINTIQDAANCFNARVYHCELSATVKPSDTVYPDFTDGMLLAVFNAGGQNGWIVADDAQNYRFQSASTADAGGIARYFDSTVYLLKIIAHADPELIRHGYN